MLAALALPALAAEVAGVRFADQAQVAGSALRLSGAGVRQRFVFDVYAVALYVADPKADRVTQGGAKRVAIHMLRDVDADTFSKALADGMRANHDGATMKALEGRIAELNAIMAAAKEAKKGMAIQLDWVPGSGTHVLLDGREAGKPIAGEDFYQALLRVWLGPKPVQGDLKKALLGG
ncbi:MAG TPA: chalcone isomerase family protein [Burkholderiales bacterium]|nr:chalcone isomerase family protein [Burkholderiales bacterium]